MKGFIIFGLCLCVLSSLVLGCGKKQESLEQMQEPLSVEVTPVSTTLVTQTETSVAAAGKVQESQIPLPPAGPYKPTNEEIQTALKNAGHYTAEIDGKMGPRTLKAIKDFQAANNLEADGKVGPKTWSVLSKHLNPPVEPPAEKR